MSSYKVTASLFLTTLLLWMILHSTTSVLLSKKPSKKPTKKPSSKPRKPSSKPTKRPSKKPSRKPSRKPTKLSTIKGSNKTVTSIKKGFVYKLSDPSFTSKVLSVRPKWYYTWGETGNSTITLPFVPMAWGTGSLPKVHSSILLGFNEPDRTDQSNLTVQQALSLWPSLASYADRIGSPATAGNPTTAGSWLEQFMANVTKVDFVCVHWYAPPSATSFLNLIDSIWAKYKKPIWVTEFAVADWAGKYPGGYPLNLVQQFMKDACAGLENRSYVERYTWKTRTTSDVNMGTSAIFFDNGTLTSLGQLYLSI